MSHDYNRGYAAGYAKQRARARLTASQVWLSVYTAAVDSAMKGDWAVIDGDGTKKELRGCDDRMIACRDAADAAVRHAKERGYI